MINTFLNKRVRFFIVISLIIVQVVLLGYLYFLKLPSFPIGWDVPFYMSQTRYLLVTGDFAGRIGTTILFAGLHLLTGASLIQLGTVFPIILMVIFALGSAFLAFQCVQKSLTLFVLVFTLVLWYSNTFYISISTFDNAIGLILLLIALFSFVGITTNKWWYLIFFASLFSLAIIHFESFAFCIFIFVLFLIIEIISERSFKYLYDTYKFSGLIIISSLILAMVKWSNILVKTISGYYNNLGVGLNASIPYAQERNFTELLKYAKTGLSNEPVIIIFLIVVIMLLFQQTTNKFKDSKINILMAYVFAAYLILMYSVFRASIPINRSVLLLPVPLMIGVGLFSFIQILHKLKIVSYVIFTFLIVLFIILPIINFSSIINRVSASIQVPSYNGLISLNTYVKEQHITYYYVVTNTPSDYRSASAYYSLWNNWIQSIMPLPGKQNGYCMYFGTLENFFNKIPTVRTNNQEYNDTSEFSTECLNSIPPDSPIFIISNLYPGIFPRVDNTISAEKIADNLFKILPVGTTSVSE